MPWFSVSQYQMFLRRFCEGESTAWYFCTIIEPLARSRSWSGDFQTLLQNYVRVDQDGHTWISGICRQMRAGSENLVIFYSIENSRVMIQSAHTGTFCRFFESTSTLRTPQTFTIQSYSLFQIHSNSQTKVNTISESANRGRCDHRNNCQFFNEFPLLTVVLRRNQESTNRWAHLMDSHIALFMVDCAILAFSGILLREVLLLGKLGLAMGRDDSFGAGVVDA